jgi:hypothetical protein
MTINPSKQGSHFFRSILIFILHRSSQQVQQRRQNPHPSLFPDYPKYVGRRATAFALRFTVFQHLLNMTRLSHVSTQILDLFASIDPFRVDGF